MESRHGTSTAKKAAPQKYLLSEVSSILVFAGGLFALLAIWTYHPGDPSFFTNVRGPIHNACGRVGAYLASGLLECFGLGAFLIPAALVFVSSTLHLREGAVRLIATLGGMSVAVLSLTVFLTLQWKYWPYGGNLMLTGGALGVWVAEVLIRQFNALGSGLVSLAVFFLAIALSTPVSVARVGGNVIRFVTQLIWKVTKVAVAYLAYLFGLVIARLARAIGDGIQSAVESAVERSKERRALAA
jgi:S-DNA-T family DNA segregation ATPase FtsK/SpoIIIE